MVTDSGNATVPTVSLSLDVIQCSNRCRHCEVLHGPRQRHLSCDAFRTWADEIRRQADRLKITVEIGYNNSELLDHPHWREILDDINRKTFWPAFATNGRQIARHPELIDELKARGVQWLQLTLGGGTAATHDAFVRRHGAFADILTAARIAHSAGLHVSWNYLVYRPLTELAVMSSKAHSISGAYASDRFAHTGGIDQGLSLVKAQGEGVHMEHMRPTLSDMHDVPSWVQPERFATWYGAGCETEGALVTALCHSNRRIGCLESNECGGCTLNNLVAYRNGDVYPYCHERHPDYRLGNLRQDGLERIIDCFLHMPPTGIALRRLGLPVLAERYGNPASESLHNGCSLCRLLVQRALLSSADIYSKTAFY